MRGVGNRPPAVHRKAIWIDAEGYQPVRIDTKLPKGVPWGVPVFLGIDLHQPGFTDIPAGGYGTELRVVVFWMENTYFRRTDA
jgi:hypothetical protein